jgi:hypothetical protein
MSMRKLIVALTVAVMALGCWAGVAVAAANQDIYERIKFMQNQIKEMEADSVYSNVYIDSTWIDLSNISTTGTVIQHTYTGGSQTPTTSNFTIPPRSFDSAIDKVVRYILGNVANVYRPEPLNTEITMITHERTSVPVYVYGPYKAQAIDELTKGLPDCFSISYDTSSGRSTPTKPIKMPVAETILKTVFSINDTVITVNAESDNPTTVEMDVAPEIIGDRTFVPVRFLAYSLGVPEEGIQWDGAKQLVTITTKDITIQLTIGSFIGTVNGEPIEMDAAPYIKEIDTGGRTMLPARWVAEPLGATVTWDETAQQVLIEVTEAQ